MRKKDIVLLAVVSFICAGVIPIQSCSVKIPDTDIDGKNCVVEDTVKIGGEEEIILEDTTTPNGQSNKATLQDIEDAKKYLEQVLIDNYDVFNQIVSYLEEEPVRYSIRNNSGEIIARILYDDKPGFQVINFSEIENSEQIIYVLNDLGFSSITEDNENVYFNRVNGADHPQGGSYTQGLVCNKSNAGDEKITEWDGGSLGQNTYLRDEWFYYYRRGNH